MSVLAACSGGEEKTGMRVLCAGSLMMPFNEIEAAFEAQHPDIDVLVEGHGSIQVIRHVTELHEESDVMVVADYSLIPMMMYNTEIPETGESYTDWYITFATNSLGIAYTPSSRYAGEINGDNWHEILSRPDIKLGMADPRLDACGYRALMLLSLAETYYRDDSLFEGVLGTFNPAIELVPQGTATRITVPEIIHPESEKIVLRGSSIRMLALLESGDIDYAFEYRSVSEQHNLEFVGLPPEIDLGSVEYTGGYGNATVLLDFHRFSSVRPEFIGQPIIYGVTMPRNAPHPEKAVEFIQFLFGPESRRIFDENCQALLDPIRADNLPQVPQELAPLLQ